MTPEQKGLRLAAAITGAFGLATALAAHPSLSAPIVMLADLLIWPIDGAETGSDPVARLMFAIGGGMLAAFGWMVWQLAGTPMTRDPVTTRSLIRQAVLVWFCVDSTGSVLADAATNVVGNVPFLALLLGPTFLRPENGTPARQV
jgi:hypothetical protein